ncbi:speckle-type POZ protein-like [Aphidius gifuensis]|uniref:speckle-type POZ protein-like n=1 Tax=Aphidius gifuensis TaxID=684658 RepID=UPI001CDBA2BF|nr:speckle-type POZ protein-like [Aphidius gifuensis]
MYTTNKAIKLKHLIKKIKKKNRMSTITKQSTKICQGLDTRIDIYLWKIENFTQHPETNIMSPAFGPKPSDALCALTFSCYLNTTTFTLDHFKNKQECSLQTSFEIAIININSSKNIQTTEKNIHLCKNVNELLYNVSVKIDINLFKVVKSDPSSWLPNDVLTISIKVVRVLKSLPTKINHPSISGLPSYLENERFSDIILEVDGKEFKAHKMILSLKSPVFSAMFDHESMKESRDNRVVIKDIDADVVKQMLEYIYTGKTPSKINDCVHDLIGAADKYHIDDLREICENNLMEKLTVDNAVHTLIVADRYDAKELKTKVVEFIKQNVSIIDSADFEALKSNNANLAIEILRKLIPLN